MTPRCFSVTTLALGLAACGPAPEEAPPAAPIAAEAPIAGAPIAADCASVEASIKSMLIEQLGLAAEDIRRDAHLVQDLGADSLDVVELVMALEEEFAIEIPDEQAEGLLTVGAVVTYVESRLSCGAR